MSIHGVVFDQDSHHGEVRAIYLQRFLGCEQIRDPAVDTRDWNTATKTLANQLQDKDEMALLHQGRLATLANQANTIDAQEFRAQFVPEHAWEEYDKRLADKQISALTFQKDTSMVEKDLAKTTLYLEDGIRVYIPSENWEEFVTRGTDPDGAPFIKIRGNIERMG